MAGSLQSMRSLDAIVADLRRLAEPAHAQFQQRPDTIGLFDYVKEFIVPLFAEALGQVRSTAAAPHHLGGERQLLIHYTSVKAVVSMLHSVLMQQPGSSLRLYDSEHTNDPEEGRYFFRELNLALDYPWTSETTPSHAYLTSFILPWAARDEDGDERGNSKKDLSDDLTFWSMYGDGGRGCSLEVTVPSSILRGVQYGPSDIDSPRDDIRVVLDTVSSIALLDHQVGDLIRQVLWEALAEMRYLYKDIAYKPERECRVVVPRTYIPEARIQFEYQDQSGYLRRYCEYEALEIARLLSLSETSITIGPAATGQEDLRESLALMTRRLALPCAVKISGIPYRAL